MAFSQKKITVQFELANGEFQGGGNTATVSGLRVSCKIVSTGNGSGQAEISIWGLPLELMNQLSTLGSQLYQTYHNGISVLAGDDETGQNLVFVGDIIYAYVEAQAMPDVCFRISARPGHFSAMKPIPPISIRGSGDVAQMMKGLAGQMGFGFENAGVNVKLANPYYPGTAMQQAIAIARHGNFTIGFDRGTMVIVQPGKARDGDAVLISPQTSMIGYPMFQEAGIMVRALYDPAVKYQGLIEVKSDLTPACGIWNVISLVYQLEAMMPHGKWEMVMDCVAQDAVSPA
ncbi:baseplate hub protein [Bradyrhizobium sp. Arg314]